LHSFPTRRSSDLVRLLVTKPGLRICAWLLMRLRPPALHHACAVSSPTGPPDLRLAAHQPLDNSGEMPRRRVRVRLRRGAGRRGARVALDIGPDLDERDGARVREVVTHLL